MSDRVRRRRRSASFLLVALAAGVPFAWSDWRMVRSVDGVVVESRSTASGFNVHRGETAVCADVRTLEIFVEDTSRFPEWLPFTRSARLLQTTEDSLVYYVRSTTPWPMKDRDMVYRITRHEAEASAIHLELTGLPDYAPPEDDVERIKVAEGEWRLAPSGARTEVSYELYLDPGAVPAYLANRRLAYVVGRTLANLAAQFPCRSA
jgi:hypothetical protein